MTNDANELGEVAATRALRSANEAVLVLPADDRVTLVVTGEDRLTWLNGLVTCNLAPLKPAEAIYGLAVTPKGRVLADFVLLVGDDRLHLSLPRAAVSDVRASFERYLVMEDAELLEPGGDEAEVARELVGPKSAALLEVARAAGACGAPLDRMGLGGGWVVTTAARAPELDRALAEAAARLGGGVGDEVAREAVRIARAVPRFGLDFDGTTYPQEAGLETRAVSFNKGCYLGQEVVCMLEMRGHVKRRLVSLTGDDAPGGAGGAGPSVQRGAKVTTPAGDEVGEVTSVSPVGMRSGACALAMVKRAQTEPGTALKVGDATVRVAG